MQQSTITEIAKVYIASKHEPLHPSWTVFCRETFCQFWDLQESGFKFDYCATPMYDNAEEMFYDIRRKRLTIFTGGQKFVKGHPLARSPFGGYPSINEMFRAVHDVNGHFAGMADFTLNGELDALRQHKYRYTTEAWPALFGETLGQLCYFHDGNGFPKRQKAIVLPRKYHVTL